jgi:hypothetical protein
MPIRKDHVGYWFTDDKGTLLKRQGSDDRQLTCLLMLMAVAMAYTAPHPLLWLAPAWCLRACCGLLYDGVHATPGLLRHNERRRYVNHAMVYIVLSAVSMAAAAIVFGHEALAMCLWGLPSSFLACMIHSSLEGLAVGNYD